MEPKSHWSLLAYINISKELLSISLRDKSKIALFSKLSNFYFDLRPPPGAGPMGRPPGKSRGAKTRLECANPRGSPGGGGWSGLELTDTL